MHVGSAGCPPQLGAVDLQELLLQECYIVLLRCFSCDWSENKTELLFFYLFIYFAGERSLKQRVRAPNYSAGSESSPVLPLAAHSLGLSNVLALIPFLLFSFCHLPHVFFPLFQAESSPGTPSLTPPAMHPHSQTPPPLSDQFPSPLNIQIQNTES